MRFLLFIFLFLIPATQLSAKTVEVEMWTNFNGEKKNISVPFRAITSFTDPSVGFGLQFKIEEKFKDTSLSKIERSDLNKTKITNLSSMQLLALVKQFAQYPSLMS